MARASGLRGDAATRDVGSTPTASILPAENTPEDWPALQLVGGSEWTDVDAPHRAPRATLVLCPGCGYSYWCPRGGVLPAGEWHCNKGSWIFDREALDWIAWRPGVDGWGEPEEVGLATTGGGDRFPHPLMIVALFATPALLGLGGVLLWELAHPAFAIALGLILVLMLGAVGGNDPYDDGWSTE